jgi:hypothetical protein
MSDLVLAQECLIVTTNGTRGRFEVEEGVKVAIINTLENVRTRIASWLSKGESVLYKLQKQL